MQQNDSIATIAEHERRLAAALDRIGKGVDRLAQAAARPAPRATQPATAEVAQLREALEAEKATNAQLTERLKALRERDGSARRDTEARIEAMTRQLDVQGLELGRMKKTTIQLRDTLRAMTDAAVAATPEPHLINKAMLTELEALRAIRQTEIAEMDEILAALAPLAEEAAPDA